MNELGSAVFTTHVCEWINWSENYFDNWHHLLFDIRTILSNFENCRNWFADQRLKISQIYSRPGIPSVPSPWHEMPKVCLALNVSEDMSSVEPGHGGPTLISGIRGPAPFSPYCIWDRTHRSDLLQLEIEILKIDHEFAPFESCLITSRANIKGEWRNAF